MTKCALTPKCKMHIRPTAERVGCRRGDKRVNAESDNHTNETSRAEPQPRGKDRFHERSPMGAISNRWREPILPNGGAALQVVLGQFGVPSRRAPVPYVCHSKREKPNRQYHCTASQSRGIRAYAAASFRCAESLHQRGRTVRKPTSKRASAWQQLRVCAVRFNGVVSYGNSSIQQLDKIGEQLPFAAL